MPNTKARKWSVIVYLGGIALFGLAYWWLDGMVENSVIFIALITLYLLALRAIGKWIDNAGSPRE